MHFILLKDFVLFSKPMSDVMTNSYEHLSPFLCEVQSKKGSWSGFGVGQNLITTTHLLGDEKELDITFFNDFGSTAFLQAKDDMVGLFSVASHPKQPELHCSVHMATEVGMPMFILGNFLGVRRSVTRAVVSAVISKDDYPTHKYWEYGDWYSTGSPLFSKDGTLMGMLLAYVPRTEQGIAVTYTCQEGQLVLT